MVKKLRILLYALALAAGGAVIVSLSLGQTTQAAPRRGDGVYYLNFKPEQATQWEKLAQTYTAATGVPVTVVTAASGTYEDTLRSEMEKPEPPTLFQVNGPVGLAAWQDYCLDLTDTALYQRLKSDDFALKANGQVLAVAYAIETYGLIYNRELLTKYCQLPDAVIQRPEDIRGFAALKAVAEDIQARRQELGVQGAFTSAGMDFSSDWRFKTHLANLPLYFEYQSNGGSLNIQGTHLRQFRDIWDLYLQNAVCAPTLIGGRTGQDALAEFTLGEAVFYQNGTWAYEDLIAGGMRDEQLGMLPIYIGAEGEEQQGLCTGSENYWCINRQASPEKIEATKAFVEWLITSDAGRQALSRDMGFVTPFDSFAPEESAQNPLLAAAEAYLADGREPVGWLFPSMPSETWKSDLGAAMLEYAQGTGSWAQVESAFRSGWPQG